MTERRGPTRALIVSATHSGAGKTTATAALIRGLRDRGLRVQPFKLGPDFIDTAYLSELAGRKAINLDLWMMGEAGVRRSFAHWIGDANIAVVEAMGALHDGADGSRKGSAAQVAEILDLPVILVLDVAGMTRTAAAVLQGMIDFEPEIEVAGVILNRLGSPRHAEMVIGGLPPRLRPLVVGAIPREAGLEIPERHLGLLTAEENEPTRSSRDAALGRASSHLDLSRAVGMASPVTPDGGGMATKRSSQGASRARLAVARDRAFCFYYEENLRLLSQAGFELVPFQPTVDPHLPPQVDAVYLGGGYPESFAVDLASNRSLSAELRKRAHAGMPLYAECGGLLYLARSLTNFDGSCHEMSGVLPVDIVMDRKHLAISYVTVRTAARSLLGPAGTTARGQEFHQSRITDAEIDADLYEITTSDGRRRRRRHARPPAAGRPAPRGRRGAAGAARPARSPTAPGDARPNAHLAENPGASAVRPPGLPARALRSLRQGRSPWRLSAGTLPATSSDDPFEYRPEPGDGALHLLQRLAAEAQTSLGCATGDWHLVAVDQ